MEGREKGWDLFNINLSKIKKIRDNRWRTKYKIKDLLFESV